MSPPGRQRVGAVAFGVFALALGGGLLAYGIGDLTALLRGFGERRDVVASDHFAVCGIILGVFSLSLAAVFILSPSARQPSPRRGKGPSRAERLAGPYLLFVLACILLALFAPLLQQMAVASAAASRGYVHCPEVSWPRHQPDRWARPGSAAACPREGASPTS